ncbi:MAG: hypothetical protein ACI97A_001600 [Planctomycetota bacterium]|jgi:hypothetical protein
MLAIDKIDPSMKLKSPWFPNRGTSALIIFIITIVVNSWALNSAYRADDYRILSQSGPWLSELLQRTCDFEVTESISNMHRGNFRPAVWALNQWEWNLSGGPSAFAAHLISLLIHALVNLTLFLFVFRLGGSKAAWISTLIFAVHPAGIQAVTWTAARADVLLGLFVLLSASFALRGGPKSALVAGILAALALGSKASSLTALPLLFVLVITCSKGKRVASLAAWSLPVLVGFCLRWIWLGTWGPWFYMNEPGLGPAPLEALVNGQHLLQILVDMLVPWTRETATPPFLSSIFSQASQALWALPMVFLVVLGLTIRKSRLSSVVFLAAFMVLLLPLLSVWTDLFFGQFQNRNQYLPFMACTILLGLSAAVLIDKGGILRKFAQVSLVLISIMMIDALISFARVESEASTRIKSRIESLHEIVDSLEQGVLPLIIDDEEFYGGQYLLGTGIVDAFQTPFRQQNLNVLHSAKNEAFNRDILQCQSSKIAIIESAGHHLGYALVGPIMPMPLKQPVTFKRAPELGPNLFRPLTAVTGRACAVFMVPIGPGPRAHMLLTATFANKTFAIHRWIPASETDESIVLMDLPTASLFAGKLENVEIALPSSPSRQISSIVIPRSPELHKDYQGSRTPSGFTLQNGKPGEIVRVVTRGPGGDRRIQINIDWRRNKVANQDRGFTLLATEIDSSRPFVERDALREAIKTDSQGPVFWRIESYDRFGESWLSRWFPPKTTTK